MDEMKAQLAQRLFGWRPYKTKKGVDVLLDRSFEDEEWAEKHTRSVLNHLEEQNWNTTGAGMLQVILAMEKKGWMWFVCNTSDRSAKAYFWNEYSLSMHGPDYGLHAPMAVARAALSALEAERAQNLRTTEEQ